MTEQEALEELVVHLDYKAELGSKRHSETLSALRALMQRDADVRELDRLAEHRGRLVTPHPSRDAVGEHWVCFGVPGISERSPEAARHAAAEWVRQQSKETGGGR